MTLSQILGAIILLCIFGAFLVHPIKHYGIKDTLKNIGIGFVFAALFVLGLGLLIGDL